ncbi:hypothetical protein QG082_05845 [Kingella kingae]|uniref:hypothetical protein n=1 Tax=Kingella kingae TaxID=504 RepID=UPI002550061C|nr:hypothetical protein [Kingella kingae]MDK4528532.1 hypothetical protein [Kingella kingae]MDK4543023.1 hypothetical protein [Kingella kingae]MDK4602763.1 hypothetical protein [Kingella kingae]MDK4632759.1 hypothetical protein [Kingella kingae]MDK4634755.1 hypothetical protein [Kingella kingae]
MDERQQQLINAFYARLGKLAWKLTFFAILLDTVFYILKSIQLLDWQPHVPAVVLIMVYGAFFNLYYPKNIEEELLNPDDFTESKMQQKMRNIVKRAIVTFMAMCVGLVFLLYINDPTAPLWFMMPFILMVAISVTWFVIAEERKLLQQQAQIMQQQQNQHDE